MGKNVFFGRIMLLAAVPRLATGKEMPHQPYCHFNLQFLLYVRDSSLNDTYVLGEPLPKARRGVAVGGGFVPLCAERDLLSESAHCAPVFIVRSSTQLINQNGFHERWKFPLPPTSPHSTPQRPLRLQKANKNPSGQWPRLAGRLPAAAFRGGSATAAICHFFSTSLSLIVINIDQLSI